MILLTKHWADPDGIIHNVEVGKSHTHWVQQNFPGKEPIELVRNGWYQIRYFDVKKEISIDVYKLSHLPATLEKVLIELNAWGVPAIVEDYMGNRVEVKGYNKFARAISRAYCQGL